MDNCNQYLGQLRMNQLPYGNVYSELHFVLSNCQEEYPTNIAPAILNDIIVAILHDFPEFFWFEGKWKYGMNNDDRKCFRPIYHMDKREIANAKEKIYQLLLSLDDLFGNAKEIDVAKGIYQWIAHHIEYGVSSGNGQNIYDALIHRKAVCKGIAKAYQLLLSRYGIFCSLAVGSLDGINRHVWNVINIEDKFYNVDICMEYKQFSHILGNDTRNSYKGFLLSDRQVACTHSWEANYPYRLTCDYEVDDDEFI